MKCKECGQEVKGERWELWDGWSGCDGPWGKSREPIGKLKRVRPYLDSNWEYYIEEDNEDLCFWRKKK